MTESSHTNPIVIIDDEDIVMIDDDEYCVEVTDPGRSLPTSILNFHQPIPYLSQTSSTSRTQSFPKLVSTTEFSASSSIFQPSHRIQPSFRSLDWGPKSSSGAQSSSFDVSQAQSSVYSSLIRSPSPSSSWTITGTKIMPIEITDDPDIKLKARKQSTVSQQARCSSRSFSPSVILKNQFINRQSFSSSIDDEDHMTQLSNSRRRASAFRKNKHRLPNKEYEVIDLDELFDEDEEIKGPKNLQRCVKELRVQDVYKKRRRNSTRRDTLVTIPLLRRNPTIFSSFCPVESYEFRRGDVTYSLRLNKVAEDTQGNYVRVRSIFVNNAIKEIKVIGDRLTRTRDLNGILERKLNEVVLGFEVDEDDPRNPEDQSAIEISLNDIVKLRQLRFTNQPYPLCRLTDPSIGCVGKLKAGGGFTTRWKFTSTYATARKRVTNEFTERRLERVQPDECHAAYAISNEARRWEWRRTTTLGGAYQPTIQEERQEETQVLERIPASPISIASTPNGEHYETPLMPLIASASSSTSLTPCLSVEEAQRDKKRRHGSPDFLLSEGEFCTKSSHKKMRGNGKDMVEETRKGVANITLQSIEHSPIDLTSGESALVFVSGFQIISASSSSEQKIANSPIPQQVALLDSDLSKPPPIGLIQSSASKQPVIRTPGQQFTYGDAFCGAGGATRGAVMAGLHVKWGFDFAHHACSSWRANFPSATCYHMAADQFVQSAKDNLSAVKVDILHLSPPCQFFSPAHTVMGVDDEMNVASLFAVQSVIEVSKARVVTLEQTFGIACPRFRFYFNALIQMFTTHDFGVRWSIVPLAQWGLPQRRNRLIIIASCPGEVLPRMPPPTHCDPAHPIAGLLPYTSVAKALSEIPPPLLTPENIPQDPLHTLTTVLFQPNRHLPPWDAHKILPRAMTTSGGQNYHPSGKRDLTLREYATLQGFPQNHVFEGNGVKKQIGNAVPPCVAKVLFGWVKKEMEEADGVVDREVVELE